MKWAIDIFTLPYNEVAKDQGKEYHEMGLKNPMQQYVCKIPGRCMFFVLVSF